MLFTKSFIFTTRETPKIADCTSHSLLLKGSYITMMSSGIYSYLPLGLRVLTKLTTIIRKHLNAAGAQELLMTALQPIELWQKTGRDKTLSEVMFTFNDRKGKKLCLGPTHEEAITEIARRYINSYKQLPCILYQIQTKFRDEPRPRFGMMRGCEFIMKDAYSFDTTPQGLQANYEKMLSAYNAIFSECGISAITCEADSGAMGGSISHEFMVEADIGEDTLYYCATCGTYYKEDIPCPGCREKLQDKRMIEIGHIFQLGTKYSQAQNAYYLDSDSKQHPYIMGCYGIGVSRLIPAIVETNSDDRGIIWPRSVSPFDVLIVVLDTDLIPTALDLQDQLSRHKLDTLIDDRPDAAGVKFHDASLLGIPYTVVLGKKYKENKTIEVEHRATQQKQTFTTTADFITYITQEPK